MSSFYCKNMDIRGLFCGKNHDEENRRRKGKKVTVAKGLPYAALLNSWILINHAHSALKYYNITTFVNVKFSDSLSEETSVLHEDKDYAMSVLSLFWFLGVPIK